MYIYTIPILTKFFQADLEDMLELSEMRQELMERVTTVINKATEYRNSFDTYAYLWVDDRSEFMRQFLLYNHVLTAEEIEAHVEDGVPECPPTLQQFKEQVMQLKLFSSLIISFFHGNSVKV
jgi:dynein heavy chain